MEEEVDDIIKQLANHTAVTKENKDIALQEGNVQEFLITKTGTLVEAAVDSMQTIKQTLGSTTDAEEITALAKLIEASAKAIDALNTLYNAAERNKTSKEIKQMEIKHREKMREEDEAANKEGNNFILTDRESVLSFLSMKQAKGKVLEESTSE